jgi:hypothetical protein
MADSPGMSQEQSSAWNKWRDLIDRQQACGLSVAAFCRRNGLAQSSFFAWKRKLAAARPAMAMVTPAFIEAKVAGAQPAKDRAGRIGICLGNGRRLIVGQGVDRDLLAEVLAIVEGLA